MPELIKFDFNALRFTQSDSIAVMTNEEIGQYILLLAEAWLSGKDATLPDNLEVLARKARCRKVADRVLAQFPVVKTALGDRRQNETLYNEWRAANERIDLAKEYGRRGGEAKREASRVPTGSLDSKSSNPLPYSVPNRTVPYQTIPDSYTNTGQCSFKNIAIQYGSFFGGHHSHGKKHIERYQAACSKYGEDKVLEYFKRWAEGSGWLREKRDSNGLNFFWKPLDEMAEGDTLREEREKSTSQSEQTEKVEVNLAMAADQSKRDEEVQKELTRIAKEKEFEEAHRYEI